MFVLYAFGLSASRFAFAFWFPFILVPCAYMILAFTSFSSSGGIGSSAPLEGVANIVGIGGLIVFGGILWLAILVRPTADGAYRSQIVIPTILGYGFLALVLQYFRIL